MQVYGGMYFAIGAMNFIAWFVELMGPIVLQKVIESSGDEKNLFLWLLALLLAKVAKAILFSNSCVMEQTLGIRFVGALKGLVFKKLVSRSTHRDRSADPDMVNVYTADIDDLTWAALSLINLCILPLYMLAVSYMLYQELGLAAVAGITMIALNLFGGTSVSNFQSTAFGRVSSARDARLGVVKETFESMLQVKLHVWEQARHEKIKEMRGWELTCVWHYLIIGAIGTFASSVAPLVVSVTSFAVYTQILQRTLTTSTVFTSIALFRLLDLPFRSFFGNLTAVVDGKVSADRVLTQSTESMTTNEAFRSSSAVRIDNGSFSHTPDEPPVLRDISLTIDHGELDVIQGKVGKSSLCLAILGELYQTQGTSGVQGSIAYCPQEPWIQQMTVRDNILFGSPFDARKYSRVVDACGLLPDFEAMAHGDLTMVGSKGSTLSGGQKARMSLARACYSDADIVILDLPLAAIDAVVQKEIMTKCIETLLKMKTVILVTHNPDVIGADSVNRLVTVDANSIEVQNMQDKLRSPIQADFSDKDSQSLKEYDLTIIWAQDFDNLVKGEPNDEERASGQVDFSVYASFISACGGVNFVAWLCIVQILWQGFQIASDMWISNPDATSRATSYIAIYSILCLICALLVLSRTLLVAFASIKASRSLFNKMTSALLGTSMTFFDTNPLGRIFNRYSQDTATIDTRLASTYDLFVSSVFSLLGSFLTSIVIIQWASLLFVPILYIAFQLCRSYLRPSRELVRLVNVTASPVLCCLTLNKVEVPNDLLLLIDLVGCVVLRAFGAKYIQLVETQIARRIDDHHRMKFASSVLDQWFDL
ncbi:hypothetical protein AC1031_000318 [Aphanomyces cochlioides]|nr:hypothetical protein AC1031_000318 [Aphanomyces cochlioides]